MKSLISIESMSHMAFYWNFDNVNGKSYKSDFIQEVVCLSYNKLFEHFYWGEDISHFFQIVGCRFGTKIYLNFVCNEKVFKSS